jgi:hypothetical protein
MKEKLGIDNEYLSRKKYENFRKEIIEFKNLPESNFSDVRDAFGKIDSKEAKNITVHGIINRINNESFLTEKQKIELTHLWEKEILGFTNKRVMYDTLGNIME